MFDLSVNAIKSAMLKGEAKFKSYTTAYEKIRRYLEKGGFEQEQGSGYTSKKTMSTEDVQNIFFTLGEKNPWLSMCMTRCRLSSFEEGALKYADLMQDIQDGANSARGTQGGFVSVPDNYKPTRDPREKAQAEALRETLRGGSTVAMVSTARVSVGVDKKPPESAVNVKTPQSKDKDKGAGL